MFTHCSHRGTRCESLHKRTTYKKKEGGAGSAGAVGAAAAAVAAAAAAPVLAAFEWIREDCAPGVCWITHPEHRLSTLLRVAAAGADAGAGAGAGVAARRAVVALASG